MKKILSTILLFVLSCGFIYADDGLTIQVLGEEAQIFDGTIKWKDSKVDLTYLKAKNYVGVFSSNTIKNFTLDGQTHQYDIINIGTAFYRDDEDAHYYYFNSGQYDARTHRLRLSENNNVYIEEKKYINDPRPTLGIKYAPMKIETVLADEMLGTHNLIIGDQTININKFIEDVRYDAHTQKIYAVTVGAIGRSIKVEKYIFHLTEKPQYLGVVANNTGKNTITKELILAKNSLKTIKNGNKYIKTIDSISEKKLLLLEKKVEPLLDQYNRKNYLSSKQNNIKHILEYIYYKSLYTKGKNEGFKNEGTEIKKIIEDFHKESFLPSDFRNKIEQYRNSHNLSQKYNQVLTSILVLSQIGDHMNHQDYESVHKKFQEEFMIQGNLNQKKILTLVNNIDYSSIFTLSYILKLNGFDGDYHVLAPRLKLYPEEQLNAAMNARLGVNKSTQCDILKIDGDNSDFFEKEYCIHIQGYENYSNPKIIIKSKKDLEFIDSLDDNIQTLSDKGIYYSITYNHNLKLGKKEDIYLEKQYKLGKEIIKHDKQFANGYLLILGYFNETKQCEKYDEQLEIFKKNYTGTRPFASYDTYHTNCNKQ